MWGTIGVDGGGGGGNGETCDGFLAILAEFDNPTQDIVKTWLLN